MMRARAIGMMRARAIGMMRARAIGMMQMRDDNGLDDEIIAIHLDDPASAQYTHIRELQQHTLHEL